VHDILGVDAARNEHLLLTKTGLPLADETTNPNITQVSVSKESHCYLFLYSSLKQTSFSCNLTQFFKKISEKGKNHSHVMPIISHE